MAEPGRTETEVAKLYPFVLRNSMGSDEIAITTYKNRETTRYVPRFFRTLPLNKTIEVEIPQSEISDGETHYFSVTKPPTRGASPDGIYVTKIEKPLNLEELRTQGNLIVPDELFHSK